MPGISFRRPSKVRKTRLVRQTSRRERATSLFRLCRRFGARRRNADRTAGTHRLLEHRQCTLRGVRQEDATRQRRMQVGLDLDHVIDEHGAVSFAGKNNEAGCSSDSIQPSDTIESTVDQLSRLPALETPVDHPRPALCRVLLARRAWRPMHAPSRFDADMKRRRGNDSMKTGTMSPAAQACRWRANGLVAPGIPPLAHKETSQALRPANSSLASGSTSMRRGLNSLGTPTSTIEPGPTRTVT